MTEELDGPSPPVRGKRRMYRGVVELRGSIPARAGEAPIEVAGYTKSQVHPRPCGGSQGYRIAFLGVYSDESARVI